MRETIREPARAHYTGPMDPSDLLDHVSRAAAGGDLDRVLALAIEHFGTDTGTLHLLGEDGALHLAASGGGLPQPVLDTIAVIPVGKGMAGLAVERAEPVTACNIQTDTSGDVRPGAKATGLEGAICVPVLRDGRAVGALGVANREERDFTDAEQALLLDVGRAVAGALAGRGQG